MNIEAYLERIGYGGSLVPGPQTLKSLQMAHLLTVPFENLSIHAREPIVLEDEALFDKIVTRRRGGFCYELNGLFATLLRGCGFDVSILSARVASSDGSYTPDFDHMTLLVTLEDRWLVDVGFGDTFREPLRLDERKVQRQVGGAYRIVPEGGHLILMERKRGDDWKPQYRFDLHAYRYSDYEERCSFHQTSPESHFRKSRVCSKATSNGRLTLSDLRLIRTSLKGDRQERVVATEEEYALLLLEYFGVAAPVPGLQDAS